MDTKELVEKARSLAAQIDPLLIGGRDAALLNGLADAIERLERERDEANANARMYEATAKEAARGLECLSDIDDAWDAIGTRGNRKALTLAEQISSLARELDEAESEAATLRARVAKMEEAVKALSQPKALTEAMEFTGLSAETLLAVRDYINKRYAVGPKP